jgi:hypothetical protein
MSNANPLSRVIAAVAGIAILIAFVLALIVVRSRNAARQASAQISAVFGEEQPLIAQANQREQERDRTLAQTLGKISRVKRVSKDPKVIVGLLPAAFPTLPEPLSISLPPPTSDEPAPPSVITVPQDDLAPLLDHLEDCRVCQQQLAVAQQDLRDERAKVSALTAERAVAVKAAHGGGFWSHLRTGAKWFAIGGAVGALAASAARR